MILWYGCTQSVNRFFTVFFYILFCSNEMWSLKRFKVKSRMKKKWAQVSTSFYLQTKRREKNSSLPFFVAVVNFPNKLPITVWTAFFYWVLRDHKSLTDVSIWRMNYSIWSVSGRHFSRRVCVTQFTINEQFH